jgi:hypothetical protein
MANFRQNQATVESPASSGKVTTITATGLQAFGLDFKFKLEPVGNLHYALEGFYQYHPYTNSVALAGDAESRFVLGDDGGAYGAGLAISYIHPSQNFLSVSAGYRRPGSELSPEIYWKAEGALAWKWVALVAGAEGIQSLNQDPYTGDVQNKPQLNTGGSSLYNSINRQFLAPYAGLNLRLGEHWRVEGRAQAIMAQRSYDSGQLFSLSLVKRFESDTRATVDNSFKEYDVEASVAKVSDKKQFVILNKGLAAGIQKGQRFDLYYFDYEGGNVLLARGVVLQVNSNQAVLQITTRFSNKYEIKEGTVARGVSK